MVQMWPLTLATFYSSKGRLSGRIKTQVPLRFKAVEFRKMLYSDEIEVIGGWSQRLESLNRELLEAWEAVLGFDTMKRKNKLHLLCHMPMFVRKARTEYWFKHTIPRRGE
ncbi:hypothetical protein K470DRAFT_261869 [Piedraia hortae CBS 480.64]|uniref:Uncharacterized protein n=1 Tax=Piedraia hortae CBS 480.64 TaxID=1314780 RepID=A0A6A7C8J7_9PEZI|nr:hypothetical protein K470DRAFT_261869 [Piedraia hortae CBS 480.64]